MMRLLRLFMVILLTSLGINATLHAEIHSNDQGAAVHETHRTDDHAKEAATDPVNVNTADASSLDKVKGLGPKKAEAIVKYREANGPFQSVDDVAKVRGIGSKMLKKIREQLTI
jgi:competence protein ComEA